MEQQKKSRETISQKRGLQERSRKAEAGSCVTVYSCENERRVKGRRRGGGGIPTFKFQLLLRDGSVRCADRRVGSWWRSCTLRFRTLNLVVIPVCFKVIFEWERPSGHQLGSLGYCCALSAFIRVSLPRFYKSSHVQNEASK